MRLLSQIAFLPVAFSILSQTTTQASEPMPAMAPQYSLPAAPTCAPFYPKSSLVVSASRDQRLSQCDDLTRATESDLQWHIRNAEVSCRNSGGRMVWGASAQSPNADCERRPSSLRVMRSQAGVCVTGENKCRSVESPINSAECAEGTEALWSERLDSELQNPSERACEEAAAKVHSDLDSKIELRAEECQTSGGAFRVHRKSSPDSNRCDGAGPDSTWIISRSALVSCCKSAQQN